jgi:5-deoxy-glucuronate isomerase
MLSTLADTHYRMPRSQGLTLLQRRGERGARELTTHRLTLAGGTRASYVAPGEESVVVLHRGSGTWAASGRTWDVSRKDVFAERATALWLPPGQDLRVETGTGLEAIVVSTPSEGGGDAVLCGPHEVTVAQRGRDMYHREVHDIFVRDPHVRRLMVGETFNARGQWSSYPPHKHDGTDGELRLEEMYYYRVDPPGGFGSQMLYTADGESVTHEVRDGDLVLLPYGYHPVCAAPGYRLYYLWAIAGDERRLAVYEDPAHRWVHEMG